MLKKIEKFKNQIMHIVQEEWTFIVQQKIFRKPPVD